MESLCYHAYFKERVPDSSLETYREPWEENSGIIQGQLMNRQRAFLDDGTMFNPRLVKCGQEVVVDHRNYTIVSMSASTKEWYMHVGLDAGQEQSVPVDSVAQLQLARMEFDARPTKIEVIKGKTYTHVLNGGTELDRHCKQFLGADRSVLRFFGYWDDTSEYGGRRFYRIHYYLSDNTVEIVEDIPKSSNVAAASFVFFKRSILSKEGLSPRIRDHLDRLSQARVFPLDFKVGSDFNALGRRFHIFDADTFTREYFRERLGVELGKGEGDVVAPPAEIPTLPVPPPTGFGSEEDSLLSCSRKLVLKAPLKIDSELSEIVLRFSAVLRATGRKEDAIRRFVVGFYPSDDSIAVWEIPVRNSGFVKTGKFAHRGVKTNPESGTKYALRDLVAMVQTERAFIVSGTCFLLTDMDAFSRDWIAKTGLEK